MPGRSGRPPWPAARGIPQGARAPTPGGSSDWTSASASSTSPRLASSSSAISAAGFRDSRSRRAHRRSAWRARPIGAATAMELVRRCSASARCAIFEPVEVERLPAAPPPPPTSAKLSVSSAAALPVACRAAGRPPPGGDQVVGAGDRRLVRRSRGHSRHARRSPPRAAFAAAAFEQRVLGQCLGDQGLELEVGQRQQLDRLLQLRRHHQRLGCPNDRGAGRAPWPHRATARSSRRGTAAARSRRRPALRACPANSTWPS